MLSKISKLEFAVSHTSAMVAVDPRSRFCGKARRVSRQNAQPMSVEMCRNRNIARLATPRVFDLEVLKGASQLFAQHGIHLVYLEIIFGKQYKNHARLDEIYRFLADRGFDLVSFYIQFTTSTGWRTGQMRYLQIRAMR
jgi:hypothetical protein